MIVVVGSRHDSVARDLARAWPAAGLCSAEDLITPGWKWHAAAGRGERRTWVVDGTTVPDRDATGVFLRRSAVYPDEFADTHPDDRDYLAAEIAAFLVFVLATTRATVVNRVGDGVLDTDATRPERWMGVATRLGVAVAPLRLASASDAVQPGDATTLVEVVDRTALGAAAATPDGEAAVAVAGALGLTWAVAAFDQGGRLCALSTSPPPSTDAADRLGPLLARSAP